MIIIKEKMNYMKLSDSNVTKTLNNLEEIKNKAVSLIVEMGYKTSLNDKENLILFKDNDMLIIRNPLFGEEFKIPIGYFLDEEGKHENEYKEKKEKQDKLDLERLKKYIK